MSDTPGTTAGAASTGAPSGADAPAKGGIAEAIFAEVQQMTAGGAMSKSDAFEAISTRTGRRAGTVAANYYRIARKRGGGAAPSSGRGRPRNSARASADVEAVLGKLDEAVKDLARLVRRQESEISALRERAEQFDQLKKLITRNP